MRDTKWAELDRALTVDEKDWLMARDMTDVVAANEAKYESMDDDESNSDEEPVVSTVDYDSWTSAELKAAVKERNEAGRTLDTSGMTKKSQVAQVLRDDDAAQAAEEAAE
jgi:hypothetical protein